MTYSIFDDLHPESFYSEMTEPEDDREPLTTAEKLQILKDVDEIYKDRI